MTNKRYLARENLDMAKRETESLLIVAQNNATRTNQIKARIDKTRQNNQCWLCVGTVQVQCSWRRLLRGGLEFHVCTLNKSAHTKNVWKLI